MVYKPAEGRWVIICSVLLAMWLAIVPVPLWAQWARPEWLVMVMIYWLMALPSRVGIGVAWMAGLLMDVVEGTPLGQNALALAVVAYVTLILYQRLRMFVAWQQAAVVFVLIGLNQLIAHWVQNVAGTQSPNLLFLLPALVSAMLWPWLSALLRFVRRHFRVS